MRCTACIARFPALGLALISVPGAAAQAAPAKGGDRACRLLTPQELAWPTEKQIQLANLVEDASERSVCEFEDSTGVVFNLSVYWTGGKQAWETRRAARGMGGVTLSKFELEMSRVPHPAKKFRRLAATLLSRI